MKTNSYPNWLVSLEQAKKLIEIGFDEYCVFYTRVPKKDEISGYTISVCHDPHDRIIPGMRNRDHIDTNTTFGISLPTWEQVLEWFREKGLVAVIVTNEILNEGDPLYFPSVDDLDGDYYTLNSYHTYEEARDAVFNKLIEVYKNENNI